MAKEAGIAAVGTFYAGVTVRLRAREVMLPLLMLPVLAPLLLGAVKATGAPHYSTQAYPYRNLHDGLRRIFDAPRKPGG